MRGIEEMTKSIQQLQDTIGYKFHNPVFLEVALTHSSYANEVKHQLKYNERQEFLGDAVLSIIVSDYLFIVRKTLQDLADKECAGAARKEAAQNGEA